MLEIVRMNLTQFKRLFITVTLLIKLFIIYALFYVLDEVILKLRSELDKLKDVYTCKCSAGIYCTFLFINNVTDKCQIQPFLINLEGILYDCPVSHDNYRSLF